jgi:ABC-type multidrug transport system fused ATPase/permease subunit
MFEKETQFKGEFQKSVGQALWFAYRPYSFWLGLLIVVGILGRVLLLANANIIGIWVDSFCKADGPIPCKATPEFFMNWQSSDYIHLLLLMTSVGFVLTWIFRVGFSDLSAMAISTLYDETTYRTSRFPMSFFDNTPTGRIVTRFSSDYGNVFRLFGGPLAEFLTIIFDISVMILLLAWASPYYLPAVVLIGILNFITYKMNQMRLRESRRDLSASRSPSVAHFAETAQGASTIRTFLRSRIFSDRFRRMDNYFLNQKRQVVFNLLKFSVQMNFLTACLLVLVGIMAFFLTKQGWLSIGSSLASGSKMRSPGGALSTLITLISARLTSAWPPHL